MPHGHVETINNADVTKLLHCDRTLELIRSDWSNLESLAPDGRCSHPSDTFVTQKLYLFYFFNLIVVRGTRTSEGGLKTEEKTRVSEVGFELGTLRSCVEHSNHYATGVRQIPDVLIVVLVAPKCSVVTLACMRHNRNTIKVFPQPPPYGPPRILRLPTPTPRTISHSSTSTQHIDINIYPLSRTRLTRPYHRIHYLDNRFLK